MIGAKRGVRWGELGGEPGVSEGGAKRGVVLGGGVRRGGVVCCGVCVFVGRSDQIESPDSA